jgi:hypothetical protein
MNSYWPPIVKDHQLQQIVDKTIMEADHDGDGKLSFEEFALMVSNTVRLLIASENTCTERLFFPGHCEADDIRRSLLRENPPSHVFFFLGITSIFPLTTRAALVASEPFPHHRLHRRV